VKIFSFDPSEYREQYEAQGWIHIPNGMTAEFLGELQEFMARSLAETKLDQFAIKGKKEQSLYDFPDSTDFPGEIFDVVSGVCGLNRPTMTLSERHIQAYDPDANPEPDAHKDRYPSQISLGFSISIPAESRLVLYPYDHRSLNPFNSAATFQRSLQPHELPDVALQDAREVVLDDQDGDVVMFPGSTTWHLRRRAANAVNLYVKMNDFDCDPLGEDPSTETRRTQTLAILEESGANGLGSRVPLVSRRLDFVSRQIGRQGAETLHVCLYGSEQMGLTQPQFDMIRLIDGVRTLQSVVDTIAQEGHPRELVETDARVLIDRGVVDLVE